MYMIYECLPQSRKAWHAHLHLPVHFIQYALILVSIDTIQVKMHRSRIPSLFSEHAKILLHLIEWELKFAQTAWRP